MAEISGIGFTDCCFPHQCIQACAKIRFLKQAMNTSQSIQYLYFNFAFVTM
jgi:hypothetical protein